jgi:hypothetical protein
MPFEIAPQFAPVETKPRVGQFQAFADAMLRGCAGTGQCTDLYFDGRNNTCALGALALGLGMARYGQAIWPPAWESDALDMRDEYVRRYNSSIEDDNDSLRFTREQIAARIAAL